ncbi:MAG: hypothetical protein ABJ327_20735 [Litoreibacter sp.]
MFRKTLSYCMLAVFFAAQAAAQNHNRQNPVFTFDASIDQVDKLVEGPNDVLASAFVMGTTSEVKARFEWRNDAGGRTFLDPFLRFDAFPEAKTPQVLILGVFAEHRQKLTYNENVQLRARAGLEYSRNAFSRITLQAALNIRHDKANTSQVMVRYRYRDQDDAQTFGGFDQHEMYMSFRRTWKPDHELFTRVSSLIYCDFRQAEERRFDYLEVGTRLQIRVEPQQNWRLTATAKGFVRQYGDNFSTTRNILRHDQRLSIDVGARYEVDARQNIRGTLGWVTNRSNIKTRAFSGATFRLEYAIDLN